MVQNDKLNLDEVITACPNNSKKIYISILYSQTGKTRHTRDIISPQIDLETNSNQNYTGFLNVFLV